MHMVLSHENSDRYGIGVLAFLKFFYYYCKMKPEISKEYNSSRLNTSCKVLEVDEKIEMCKVLFYDNRTHNFGNGTGWITWASFKDLNNGN